jgi:hypothetical protein
MQQLKPLFLIAAAIWLVVFHVQCGFGGFSGATAPVSRGLAPAVVACGDAH